MMWMQDQWEGSLQTSLKMFLETSNSSYFSYTENLSWQCINISYYVKLFTFLFCNDSAYNNVLAKSRLVGGQTCQASR